MEKTLQLLGLLAIVGSAAIVGAQVRSQGPTSPPSTGGAAMAKPISSANRNALQDVLLWHFSNKQNYAIEVAIEKKQNDIISAAVKMNCYHTLTVLNPEQQARETRDVWQVDRYVPNDPGWKAVTAAPSLANHILTISPEVDKKIRIEWGKEPNPYAQEFEKLVDELMKRPGFKDLPQSEQQRIAFEENKKLIARRPKRTPAENYALAVGRSSRVIAASRPFLTDEQRQELDAFLARYDADFAAVELGRPPSFLSK